MLVSAQVRNQFHPNVIVVPRTAVFDSNGGSNVYTVVDMPPAPGAPAGGPLRFAQAKLVPVKVGLQTDTATEIEGAGIADGTTIITTRPDALQDKSVVAIATAPAAGPGGGAPKKLKSASMDTP